MDLKSITFPGLEGEYKIPQTAEGIGAAPAGFGLGKEAPQIGIYSVEGLDTLTAAGWYHFNVHGTKFAGITFNYANVFVYPISNSGCIQEIRPLQSYAVIRRYRAGDYWSDWVDASPSAFAPASHSHIAEDVSSDFTLDPNISTATVRAYKSGNLVFFNADIVPVSMSTLQNKNLFMVANRSRPKVYSTGIGMALLDKTNASSATRSFPYAATTNGYIYCPNMGGYTMTLTTSSIINLIGVWEVN